MLFNCDGGNSNEFWVFEYEFISEYEMSFEYEIWDFREEVFRRENFVPTKTLNKVLKGVDPKLFYAHTQRYVHISS